MLIKLDKNDGGTAKFTNNEKGSLLQTQPNSWADGGWVKELEDKEGTCCKCMAEKDVKQPGNANPPSTDIKDDPLWDTWDEGVGKPPVTVPPGTPLTNPQGNPSATPPYVYNPKIPDDIQDGTGGTPQKNKPITDQERADILKNWGNPDHQPLVEYENLRNKEGIKDPMTWGNLQEYKDYSKYLKDRGWFCQYIIGPTLKMYQEGNRNCGP